MKINKAVFNNTFSIGSLLSDQTLTKKASLNALAAGLDYAARMLVSLVLTPFLVAGLGNFYFGAWQFLLRLMGYISPASGRPTQALKWTLANQQNSLDYDLKRRYVGSALLVWLIFLPILLVLGGILTWFVPYWIKAPENYFWPVRIGSGLLVANLALTTLAVIPQAVLEGENKGYKRMGLSMLLVFGGGGITWLFLYLKTGLVGVAAATLLTTLLTGAFYLSVARTFSPWFGISKPSGAMAREFLGLSWWFLGWNLVMNLMTASDVILLGILVSVETVSGYTLSKYAPEVLISFVAIVVFGVVPGLGGIIGSGDLKKAAKVRSEIMTITWLILTALGATILLWNQMFIRLWVGEEYFVGTIPNLLILSVVYQFTFIRNDANIIDLTLRLRNKVLMGLLSVAISLALAGIFITAFDLGIVGLCLGILIGRLILSIGYPLLIGRFLKVSWSSQLRGIVRPALATILLFAAVLTLSAQPAVNRWIDQSGWIGFVFSVGVTCGFIFIATFWMGLNRVQRTNIFRRFKSILDANPS